MTSRDRKKKQSNKVRKKKRSGKTEKSSSSGDDGREEGVSSLNYVDQSSTSSTSSKRRGTDSSKPEKKSEKVSVHNADQPKSGKTYDSDFSKLKMLEEVNTDRAVEIVPVISTSDLREKYVEAKEDVTRMKRDRDSEVELASSAKRSSLREKHAEDKQVLRGKQGKGSKANTPLLQMGILPTAIGKEYLKEGFLRSSPPMCNRSLKGANVCGKKFADSLSDCPSQSSGSKHHDNPCRNHLDVPSGEPIESNVPQEVVECHFNVSRGPHHEAGTMDWSRIARMIKLLGNDFESHKETVAKGECKVFREESQQYLKLWKSFRQKGEVASRNGKKQLAAYHFGEAKKYCERHRQAELKASWDTFIARNKDIRNHMDIDLHGQRVKNAMFILKLHLSVPSIKTLRVITGRGKHSGGKSDLKQSVIGLLEDECIKFSEENPGLLFIELDQHRNFKFGDPESDSN